MAKPNLTIDRELQRILTPPTDEELRLLEEAIKRDGCEDSIHYWENDPKGETPIIDGMNRFAICQRLKLPYPVTGKKFTDRAAVIDWMRTRQLGRRNLTDAARTVLRGQLYRDRKGNPQENLKKGPESPMGQNVPSGTVSDLVATEGVDRKTLQRAEKAADAVEAVQEKSPVVAAAIMSEAIPMKDAAALADATKAELKQVAAAVKTGDKKAIREAVKEAIAPEPTANSDGAPWEKEEEDDDGLVVEFLNACNTDKIKATKAQRAEFGKLDEDLQRALTADIVAGNQSLPNALKTKRVVIRDTLGNIVDDSLSAIFEAGKDFKAAMQAITQVKKQVNVMIDTAAGGWIDGQEFDRLLTNAYSILKFSAPYCECAKCRRTLKKSCPACKGSGWVQNSMYKSAFSDEDKEWITSKKK